MLETQAPPTIEYKPPQTSPFVGGLEQPDDAYFLSLVTQTFQQYEAWRNLTHENRWRTHDTLYFGLVPQRVWEGTTIPRASLPNQISYDHVEAAVPAIMQSLFIGDEWFDVQAETSVGGSVEEAEQIQNTLRYFVEHCKDEYGHTADMEIEQAIHSQCQYGNGILHIYYDSQTKKPSVEFIDIRDFYIDPATPSPNLQQSRSIIHRRLMTVDELDQMRDDPRMNIPPRDVLVWMSQNRSISIGDVSLRVSESLRKIAYSPGADDWLPLPADNFIEVLVYESKTRIGWVLNRQWVAYKNRNPYGFITYCMAPYSLVLKRCYAQSICDLLEGNQMYMQGLQNAHLDELSLALQPPRWKKRGGSLIPSQSYWRPGVLTETENGADDMGVWQSQNVTKDIRDDLAYLEIVSEKRTGINSMGQAGIPRPSNANRTASGMQMQASGSASRLYRAVLHTERYLIVPMLYMMYRLTQYHSQPGDEYPGITKEGGITKTPGTAFQAPVKFRVNGSSKMLARERLAQQLPIITQYLAAGPVLQALQTTGKTFDWDVFTKMVQDATGTAQKYQLIRQMNEQEMAAASQPPPEVMAQMQKAQMDNETKLAMNQSSQQSTQAVEQLRAEIERMKLEEQSSLEILKLIFEEMTSGNDQAIQEAKLRMEQLLGQQKLEQNQAQHDQKMSHLRESTANKLMVDSAKMQQEGQMSQAQATQDMLLQRLQGQNKVAGDAELHQAKVQQTKELGAAKVEQAKALARTKPKVGSMRERK